MAALLLLLFLATVATARAVRIIAVDKITEPARKKIIERFGPKHMIVYGLHCPMCLAIWIAPAPALLVWYLTDAPHFLNITSWVGAPLTWLTVAYLAALMIQKED